MSDANESTLSEYQPSLGWLALALWAWVAFFAWSLLVALIGVDIPLFWMGENIVFHATANDLSQMGIDVISSWLVVALLSTGAPITISFGISDFSGYIHAVGVFPLWVVIFTVLFFVGWRVNMSTRDPWAAIYMVAFHGMTMLIITLVIILAGGGAIHLGLLGLDVVWRYTLAALLAGVMLLPVCGGSFDFAFLLPKAVLNPADSHVTQLASASLTAEEIVERNIWREAVRGQAHIYCRSCGKRLSIWSREKFCIGCGYLKGIPSGERFCVGCGANAGTSDKFCFRCGIRMDRTDPIIRQSSAKPPLVSKFCCWCRGELESGTERNCPWPDCERPLGQSFDRAICLSCHQLGVYPGNPSPQYCVFCGALYSQSMESVSPENHSDSEDGR